MNVVDFLKDTYIPIFTNKSDDYKDWRQRILLYKRKSDLNKKQKATINLMTSSQWHLGNRSKGSLGKLLKQRG